MTPIENLQAVEYLPHYDKEKYREMILDAAETIPGFFGLNRTAYSNFNKKNNRRRKKVIGRIKRTEDERHRN